MAISSLVPVASSYIPGGVSVTVPAQYTIYQVEDPKNPGFYTITTNISSYQVTLQFYTATGVQQTFTTSSGTVTAELTENYLGYFIRTDSNNTDVICTITQTASSANTDRNNSYGSNLVLVTSASTYNTTGILYVMCLGGGGGGGRYNHYGAGGGGGGNLNGAFVYSTTAQSITIGTGGTGATLNAYGNSGGTTNFGNLASASGGNAPGGNQMGGGSGGGNGGSGGGNGPYQPGAQSGNEGPILNKRVRNGANGGGGGGSDNNYGNGGGTPYANGGFGVGGRGGLSGAVGTDGTGYGAGGGGGGRGGGLGSAGTAGCVYVLNGIVL